MKLSEIRDIFKTLDEQEAQTPQVQTADEVSERAQRRFDALPRIPFDELPASLQRSVRERFQLQNIREFLCDVLPIPSIEAAVKDMTAEQRAALPRPAESYVSFDTLVSGIPARDLEKILIHTRNTAIYTIEREWEQTSADGDGAPVFVPMLYAPHAVSAFTAAIDSYRAVPTVTEIDKKTGKETKHRKQTNHAARAAADKEIVSAGFYQFAISDKQYQHALTTQQNRTAYIALMDSEFFNKLDFSNGELIYDGVISGYVKQYSKGKYEDVSTLDLPLLVQIYTAAVKAHMKHDNYTITVYIPTFFKEMGIDAGTGNAADIMRKLHSFENCVGVLPGTKTISKLLSIVDMDLKRQTITFAIPYIMRIITLLDEKNLVQGKTRQGEEYKYIKPYHNTLVHSTVAAERNKPAVELLYCITSGLLQRGAIPDVKTYRKNQTQTTTPDLVTYSVTYRTLLNDAPLLRSRIASYGGNKYPSSNQNAALRRAFSRMWELLHTQTDAERYYIDLRYTAIVPTMASLDDVLTITHRGINGKYSPQK